MKNKNYKIRIPVNRSDEKRLKKPKVSNSQEESLHSIQEETSPKNILNFTQQNTESPFKISYSQIETLSPIFQEEPFYHPSIELSRFKNPEVAFHFICFKCGNVCTQRLITCANCCNVFCQSCVTKFFYLEGQICETVSCQERLYIQPTLKVCTKCRKDYTRCPSCKELQSLGSSDQRYPSMQPLLNKLLKVHSTLKVKCQFEECDFLGELEVIWDHQKTCIKRDVLCKLYSMQKKHFPNCYQKLKAYQMIGEYCSEGCKMIGEVLEQGGALGPNYIQQLSQLLSKMTN